MIFAAIALFICSVIVAYAGWVTLKMARQVTAEGDAVISEPLAITITLGAVTLSAMFLVAATVVAF